MAQLREVSAADQEAVARFLADFPGDKRGYAFWRDRLAMWWDNNPAFSNRTPRGWALYDEESIVGFVGNIPSHFSVNGREMVVYNASTWRVMTAHREASLKPWFALLAAARDTILFCTTPNELTLQILEGLGFRPLPLTTTYTSINLTYDRPLELRLGRNPATRVIAAVMNAWQAARVDRRAHEGRYKVRELAHAGKEFDSLWRTAAPVYGSTNVRTAAAVNWLVFAHPAASDRILLGCFLGERLCGASILRSTGGSGDRKLECLDLWTDPSEPGALSALFSYAIRYAKRHGYDACLFRHYSKEVAAALNEIGLGRKKHLPHQYYFKARGNLAAELLGNRSYIVAQQGDAAL